MFRNWSLDRRRVNEWRMLVGGGAVTEKGGVAETYDPAMTRPRDPGWQPGPTVGEPITRSQSWAGLLRQWSAMASDPAQSGVDATPRPGAPGSPTNRDLSQAMAFLLDMPDPVAVH